MGERWANSTGHFRLAQANLQRPVGHVAQPGAAVLQRTPIKPHLESPQLPH